MNLDKRFQLAKEWKDVMSVIRLHDMVHFIRDFKRKALENNLHIAVLLTDLVKDFKTRGIILDIAPLYEQPETIYTQEYQTKLFEVKLALLPIVLQYIGVQELVSV